ncbi:MULTISPECIES: hypothetical protein [unclassified Minwuia]|jgi:hypothetical protein|uniref:hypothetical protein n=1 Tax=unclassified Minwuia TaxID=2618799 RepID=UPI00247A51A2|nr:MULTISPECIES: hypothetical protein [unclassified Minwuia]
MSDEVDQDNITARSMRAAEDAARNRRKSGRMSPLLWAVILVAAVTLYTLLLA